MVALVFMRVDSSVGAVELLSTCIRKMTDLPLYRRSCSLHLTQLTDQRQQ